MRKHMLVSWLAAASTCAVAQPTLFEGSTASKDASATVSFDPGTHSLTIEVLFQDLPMPITGAHIHCCEAGPTGSIPSAVLFPTFPTGVTSGSFSETYNTLDASTYSSSFKALFGGDLARAEAALHAGMLAGKGYFSAHLSTGAIRANLSPVPEPSSTAMMLAGVAAAIAVVRRGRRTGSSAKPDAEASVSFAHSYIRVISTI